MEALDLEEELMDLDENLISYLPTNRTSNVCKVSEGRESEDVLTALRKKDETMYLDRVWGNARNDLVKRIASVLLEERKLHSNASRRGNESAFMMLFGKMSKTEPILAAKVVDKAFESAFGAESDNNSKEELVVKHFDTILRAKPSPGRLVKPIQHSLGTIVQDFASIFHSLYRSALENHPDTIQVALHNAFIDYRDFSSILLQVIKFRYSFFGPEELEIVERCIEASLFTHLQPTLHGLFAISCTQLDRDIEASLLQLSGSSLEQMGVPVLFCRPSYAEAIECMRKFAVDRVPSKRIETLANVCRRIDASIKKFYQQDPDVDPASLNV